jgi:hypothetical protein
MVNVGEETDRKVVFANQRAERRLVRNIESDRTSIRRAVDEAFRLGHRSAGHGDFEPLDVEEIPNERAGNETDETGSENEYAFHDQLLWSPPFDQADDRCVSRYR